MTLRENFISEKILCLSVMKFKKFILVSRWRWPQELLKYENFYRNFFQTSSEFSSFVSSSLKLFFEFLYSIFSQSFSRKFRLIFCKFSEQFFLKMFPIFDFSTMNFVIFENWVLFDEGKPTPSVTLAMESAKKGFAKSKMDNKMYCKCPKVILTITVLFQN